MGRVARAGDRWRHSHPSSHAFRIKAGVFCTDIQCSRFRRCVEAVCWLIFPEHTTILFRVLQKELTNALK